MTLTSQRGVLSEVTMKHICKFSFISLFIGLSFVSTVYACSCIKMEDSLDAWLVNNYEKSTFVFSAIITKSNTVALENQSSEIHNSFQLTHNYKQDPDEFSFIKTEGVNGTSCAIRLTVGAEYLFFLNRNRVSHCTPKLVLNSSRVRKIARITLDNAMKTHHSTTEK